MLSLQGKVVFILYFYMMPVNLTSTNDEIDFQELVAENSQYLPMKNFCSLKILGGSKIDILEVPYQVLIIKSDSIFEHWNLVCGGSIITHEHVLSAAHCFHKADAKKYYNVVAGTAQSNMLSFAKRKGHRRPMHSEVWRGISGFYIHQYYNTRNQDHDFAVLKLEFPVNFTRWVQAIPMLRPSHGIEPKEGDMCMATGFGLSKRSTPSRRLRMVCVPFVTRPKCNNLYGRIRVTDNQFCAGESGRDSCEGDSGGPITFQGYLIGIVSNGGKCGETPGIYTNISHYTSGHLVPLIFSDCVTLSINILRTISFVFLILEYNFIVTKHFTL